MCGEGWKTIPEGNIAELESRGALPGGQRLYVYMHVCVCGGGGVPEGNVAELESGGSLPRSQRLYARGRGIRADRGGLAVVKG